jgi:hypothetical protein
MTNTSSPFDDQAFMQAFLDVVIPPGGDGTMPGAGSLDLSAGVVQALETDAALGPLVQAGLAAVREAALGRDSKGFSALSSKDRVAVVESQLATHPFLMLGTARYVYTAYYQHPRVLEALGEPPRPPFPEGYDVEPTDAQLLERLRARARRR